jgi:hypothetical protein
MPIADELLKLEKFEPLTPEIKLLAIVRALEAVPVPTVIPRPPYPPVFVVRALVMLFRVMDEDTNPVSSEMPVGDWVAEVCSLIEFRLIELLIALPTSMPIVASPVVVLL